MRAIYLKFINRRTRKEYLVHPVAQMVNFRTEMFKFCSVFEFNIAVASEEDIDIASHDFVEFYYDINGKPHQLGIGYLEDFVDQTNAHRASFKANGKSLLGQLMNISFKVAIYSERTSLDQLFNRAASGEYVDTYNKLKGRSGMIIDQKFDRSNFLARSDISQKKGQILENCGKLGCTLIFEDRLGRVVLLGKDFTPPPISGRFIYSKNKTNVLDLAIMKSYSEVLSSVTVFYTQSEALTNVNAVKDRTFQNTDPRINGIIQNTSTETLNVSDVAHFAGEITPEKRMEEIAKSTIRKSNRKINQVVVINDAPFFVDPITKVEKPFEIGQLWEIESDIKKLTSKEYPNGTNLVEMVITGLNYSGTESSTEVQIQLSEPDTLI